MDKKIVQEAFKKLLDGMSLREIEKEYGINRNRLAEQCRKEFPEGTKSREKLEKILSYNKAIAATKQVEEKKLAEICEKILNEKIGVVEAAKLLGMHKQTFHNKLLDHINNSSDEEIKKRYIEYKQKRNPDYSFINFKALTIEMINNSTSQTEIAKKYGIPARTISREIEKLKQDEEYQPLYRMAKEFSHRKMQKRDFSELEQHLMKEVLEKYDEGNVIIENCISKEEREYPRYKKLVEDSKNIEGSQAEKAEKLGVSISSLRRARIKVQEYEKSQENKKLLEEGEK